MERGTRFSQLVTIELAAEAKRRGITQRAVAEAAGIGAGQFSIYIAGTRGSMTLATLQRACDFLKVAPETIIERARLVLDED